ncbi:MAG: UDP-N-acetylmuramoyl-L-alanine--D-glutamate ligase [Ruminococcus sp.]|nr:UDP-N-acetylmuramoyl-L-alanine--D-glutamate ligase [Ruminococcus sp.]
MGYIREYLQGKSVCLLGFGREGRSTYGIIEKYCEPSAVAIADLNPVEREKNSLPESVELICGKGYQDCLDRFDIVFKSPGIVLEKQPDELKCTVTSETQVFFEVYRRQIVGITGTKGKSTVTSLIYHILKENGLDAKLAGNIGIPVFDIVPEMTEDSVVVCELSCHQLEYMTVSPHIAVFLNLYEEHLDHYGTMERYYNAKKNIYLHQKSDDLLLISSDIAPEDKCSEVITISALDENADIYVSNGSLDNHLIEDVTRACYTIPAKDVKLLGVHNHYNIAAAHTICGMLGVSDEGFTRALCTFDPLSHRLEYAGTYRGIRWYDDSISTACATAIEAVKSIPDPGCILIGGMDRGIDYTPLVEFLVGSDIEVICMEASGRRVFEMLKKAAKPRRMGHIHYAAHLEIAVAIAADITPAGRSCVLSPAAASYGIFRNFEERGDVFKELIKKL